MHPSHMLSRPLLLPFCLCGLLFLHPSTTATAKQQKLSQFAQEVYNWGKSFSKRLPTGWRMEWGPSRLTEIDWLSAPAEGYRIHFIHETRKVYIPRPILETDKPTMQWHPHRCSLHLYPRMGRYAARWTRLSMHRPARVFGVQKNMILFQPDRFAAEEYPCTEVLDAVRKHSPNAFRSRSLTRQNYPKELKGEAIKQIRLYKSHAIIDFHQVWKKKEWKKIFKILRIKNVILRYTSEELVQKQILYLPNS